MFSKYIQVYVSYFSVAFITALLIVPLMRQLAFRLGAVDRGSKRRVHEGVIPRLGGIGIYLALAAPLIFSLSRGKWDDFHSQMIGILLASSLVFLIGIYDDVKKARVRYKLAMEIIAALIVYAWGVRIEAITNPFDGLTYLGWLSLPVTVLWILAITNAINLIDGLDGLAAGTGILIALTFLYLSGAADIHMKITFVILIGSLLGFLRHNFPPATIFMGDSGSLFLGFFLGSMTILTSFKATAVATVMIPVIAFAHPLMDVTYTVLRRTYRGLPIEKADREHIHHKLLEKGMSKRMVVLTLYLFNFLVMLFVLLFLRRHYRQEIIVLVFLVITAIFGLRLLGYIEFSAFARENLKNFQLARKRRYYNYLIKKFINSTAGQRSADHLKVQMTELVKEFGLSRAEIYLEVGDEGQPFFSFDDPPPPDERVMSLDFPIIKDGRSVGKVHLSKGLGRDYFLCTAELAEALSHILGRFIQTPSH